jgi:hypothetical protein
MSQLPKSFVLNMRFAPWEIGGFTVVGICLVGNVGFAVGRAMEAAMESIKLLQ